MYKIRYKNQSSMKPNQSSTKPNQGSMKLKSGAVWNRSQNSTMLKYTAVSPP